MELRNCEYCGTAYDARLSQCPLCGRTAGGQKAPAQPEPKRVRPAAENKPEKSSPRSQTPRADRKGPRRQASAAGARRRPRRPRLYRQAPAYRRGCPGTGRLRHA
ncbi:MAG: hypothetical protein ACLUFI_06545 [Oscillospiraceae bacterium]